MDGNPAASTIDVKHSYAKRGIYRVTIQGTCDNLFLHYAKPGVTTKVGRILNLTKTLYGVLIPKGRVSPLKYAYGSFFGCEKLSYVGKGVFDNLSDCKTLAHLFDGAGIQYVYPNIFAGCPNVQDFSYTFQACPFKWLYSNIFRWTVKAETFDHTFHRCVVIDSIPDKLFHNIPLANSFEMCFKSCSSMTNVPKDLFDNCYYIKNLKQCFSGGGSGQGDNSYSPIMKINHIPQVWKKTNLRGANFQDYAHGCIHAQNYNQYLRWAIINGYE